MSYNLNGEEHYIYQDIRHKKERKTVSDMDRSGCGGYECNECKRIENIGVEMVCLEAYCERHQGSTRDVVAVDR